jgi:hypothetical protein
VANGDAADQRHRPRCGQVLVLKLVRLGIDQTWPDTDPVDH